MKNTVSVNAAGLPAGTTRRTLLAGLAVLPATSISALAASHPDAALLALEPEMDAARVVCDAVADRLGAADRLEFAGQPSPDKDAAEAAEDAANVVWSDLRDRIAMTPATTLDGLRFKARVAAQSYGTDDVTMQAIVGDLLKIGGDA